MGEALSRWSGCNTWSRIDKHGLISLKWMQPEKTVLWDMFFPFEVLHGWGLNSLKRTQHLKLVWWVKFYLFEVHTALEVSLMGRSNPFEVHTALEVSSMGEVLSLWSAHSPWSQFDGWGLIPLKCTQPLKSVWWVRSYPFEVHTALEVSLMGEV